MGMPINAAGEIEAENLTLACRNAVLNMMELLQERGFSRQQAYVICSVAVDLRISNVVDVPNYVKRTKMQDIVKGIPRAHAKWIGQILGRLSRDQIADCFRAAGYSVEDVDGYTDVVQSRIAELNAL